MKLPDLNKQPLLNHMAISGYWTDTADYSLVLYKEKMK